MKRFRSMCGIMIAMLFLSACGAGQKEIDSEENLSISHQVDTSYSSEYEENLTISETTLDIKEEEKEMYLYIGEERLPVTLADNSSVDELLEILSNEDITYTADDYGEFEKVGEIDKKITSNNEQITTSPGDVILYQGNHICLYYGHNSWNFTRLGRIEGYTTEELKNILNVGDGAIEVRISAN